MHLTSTHSRTKAHRITCTTCICHLTCNPTHTHSLSHSLTHTCTLTLTHSCSLTHTHLDSVVPQTADNLLVVVLQAVHSLAVLTVALDGSERELAFLPVVFHVLEMEKHIHTYPGTYTRDSAQHGHTYVYTKS